MLDGSSQVRIYAGPSQASHIFVCFFNIIFTFQPYSWEVLPSRSFWTSRVSQVSTLIPPGMFLYLLSSIGFSIPTARGFSSNVADSRSRAFRLQEKNTIMHSVRLEPTKLIFIETRTTYQAIGGAIHICEYAMCMVASSQRGTEEKTKYI